MLKTVKLTTRNIFNTPTVMLLGGFDGLHIGHQKLVERARSFGLPVGVMCIVGGKEGESLFTLAEREKIFANRGIDFAFELPFAEIRDMSPETFLQTLERAFKPETFVCGDDFRFGKGAVGTAQTLEQYTRVPVVVQALLEKDGQKISTTRIKALLQAGELLRANELLGEPFFVTGIVQRDRGVGKTLGFPTANVLYPQGKFPIKKGVYETRVTLDNKAYRCITNYGARPTFDNVAVVTETYIDGFSGDLYGREITVSFVRYLRDIQKFADADALKTQLQADIRRVRE